MSSVEELHQQLQAALAAQQHQEQRFQELMSQAEARAHQLEQQLQQQAHLFQQQQQQQQLQQQQQAALMASAQAAASSSTSTSPPPSTLSPGANAAPQVSLRVDLTPLKPSPFSGHRDSNAELWCQEVDRYFSICGIGAQDARGAVLASTYLRDVASTWYSGAIKSGELTTASTWGELRAALVARFQRYAAARVARAALKKLRHQSKVQGYTAEFMKLMQDIPDMSVTDQIEFYLDGLQKHIALEVDRERPTTLSQAMEAAQRVELLLSTRGQASAYGPGTSQQRSRGFFSGHSQPRQQAGAGGAPMELSVAEHGAYAEQDEQEEEQQAFAMRQQSRGHGSSTRAQAGSRPPMRFPGLTEQEVERRYREGRCFACNQPGHSARQCDKRPPGNGSARQ